MTSSKDLQQSLSLASFPRLIGHLSLLEIKWSCSMSNTWQPVDYVIRENLGEGRKCWAEQVSTLLTKGHTYPHSTSDTEKGPSSHKAEELCLPCL